MIDLAVPTKKRRQHHVWQHYLKSWAVGHDLWCLFLRSGKIIRTGTGSVANKRDFYRLREMTPFHIAVVEEWIKKSGPKPEAHAPTLKMFTEIFGLKRAWEATGLMDADVEKELDVAINNLEEDFYAKMEGAAVPLLELLKNGDLDFVQNDEAYTRFTWFVGLQFARTMRIANAMAGFADHDLGPAAGALRHVIGLNVGYSLFVDRRLSRISLLSPSGNSEFVTGDFPVVNARKLLGIADPEKFVLYYPISPSCALLIDLRHSTPGVSNDVLPADQVIRYNELIAKMAVDQVFAANEAELLRLREFRANLRIGESP